VPLSKLEDWPGNPKDHDQGALEESMKENGVIGVIEVIDWPKFPKRIISGHGRKKAMLSLGMTHAPHVLYVKCPPDVAKRYLLATNRVAEMGGWQPELLLAFGTEMKPNSGGLVGTGFDAEDMQSLHERIHGVTKHSAAARVGNVKYQIIVTCNDEDHQRELVERFEAEGLSCRLLTL
jgi:hypothetical protein